MIDPTVHGQVQLGAPPAAGPDDEVFVFPASYGQRRLWFLDRFEPNSPYYNIPVAFRLTGTLDREALLRAIQEIVRRHESLRTTFAARDGQPVQVIAPALDLEISILDVSSLPAPDREKRVLQLAREEARRPFDLERGPLIRAGVIRESEGSHVVLVTMHHIVSDGWSMGVFVGEVAALYGAFAQGRPSPLPELPIQYADFAGWQRDWLQGEVLEAQLSYWKTQLAGAPDLLELPLDRPRLAVYTNVGASESLLLPLQLTRSLHELARQEGVTIFMALLAAFQTLLGRYARCDDVCVGSPIANRRQGETEGLIGLFINTLVLRGDLSGDPPFTTLLRRVREMTLGAYSHQDLPFEMLVDALQVGRDMSHSPLFQVMFILQNTPNRAQELPGIRLSQIDVDMGTSTCDMTLTISEGPEGMDASIEYNTDLFDAATIRRMLRGYESLLEAVVRRPAPPLSQLTVMPSDERHQILYRWNDVAAPRPDLCVHQRIEAMAAEQPEGVAVSSGAESLTYGMLNRRSNALARRLRALGVGPEVRVGICLEKSLEMIIAVLGVLKAGGGYVPLDPAYPQERLAFMFEDARMPVLLTDRAIAGALPAFSGEVVCLDDGWPGKEREDDGDLPNLTSPDGLAYMIYTSGTTGRPKGTMISHRSLLNAYLGWEEAYTLKTIARSHLQMANFAFDVFSGDFVRALCSGGKLVLCPREYLLDGPRLYDLMVREDVTIAEFVPAVLRNLVEHVEREGKDLRFMRVLIAGSDIWYVREYRKFLTFIGPETRLINSFGLTEATIDSTYFEAASLTLPDQRLVPIGRPFPNTRIYILDRNLQPTPIGVPGEICVAGAGLARVYHGRPELTADRFVPDPFSRRGGERMYRTGDLARFLAGGDVEFLGRMDHQVKVRGFRVELGDIETALGKHPALRDAVVVARGDGLAEKRLVAYVVPASGEAPGGNDLRGFLLEKLPDYMVPSAFVRMDALPLTPNGKVDRKALPDPDEQVLRDESAPYVAPRSATEEMMSGLWREILKVERIGVHDDFFLLGGHSLLATQLASRVRHAFGVEIPLRTIFETPTIESLASAVDDALGRRQGVEAPPITTVPREGDLPLSYAQQRLWFLDQLEPESPFYNVPEIYRISGSLDVGILERALQEVVRRHETLRSSFHARDGKPYVTIAPELPVPIPVIDLSALQAGEREGEVNRRAADAARQPLPLSQAPLFRIALLRLEPQEHVVLLVIHHIISDDWSTSVLVRELSALYAAFATGTPSPLPPLAIQYIDYAAWQQSWLSGEVMQAHLEYWGAQLRGCPALLELPTDRPRPPVQTFEGAYEIFALPAPLSLRVKEFSRQEGVTLFMTLLGAFGALLSRYSGQEDLCIGTPIANRNRGETEGLIGFFVNTLVLRTDLSGDPTFRELVRRVRETALGAYAHQDTPFEKLVDLLQPERDLSHSPLFQVMFVLQNTPLQAQQVSDLTIAPVEAHSGTAKFDLTLFMLEEAGHLAGAIEYNTDLFDRSTIQRMAGHFCRALEQAVQEPGLPVSRIDLLDLHEKNRILGQWGTGDRVPEESLWAHRAFELRAAEAPDAPALVMGEEAVSYAELNRRANRVANTLRRIGVGTETLVGVCMRRSPELVAGLLGILKAGGAYVPMDPAYPQERIGFMLADSGVRIVLAQRGTRELVSGGGVRVVCLDGEQEELGSASDRNPDVDVGGPQLAYVMYTSGSTGKPKGVMVHQGGLANYLSWIRLAYPVNGGSGSPLHSSISFDLTITSLFGPLSAGRAVHLLPEEEGVQALGEDLRRVGDYSLVKITPAHLELVRHQLQTSEMAGRTRAFIIGGENLVGETIARWQESAPDTLLVNEYGPTETVVGCCVYTVRPDEQFTGSVPIGRPIINTDLRILDGHLQPVPIGVAGELFVGGAGVARGYWRRPDLTAERFVPDPFGPSGARLYRTGDLARYRADGTMEFLGRGDDQVKIRGFRIELGEIEGVLKEHPSLQDAAVVAREEGATRSLVAYVVARGGAPWDVRALERHLEGQLPDYMVPRTFVRLEALPLTPNGKIDRRALPAPAPSDRPRETEFVAPRSPSEEIVAQTWQVLLGVKRVGANDHFFQLGGHSLLATQLVSRLREIFSIEVPLRTVFESPTVAGLARACDLLRRGEGSTLPAIVPVPRDGGLPLSFAQQRLWFLEQLEPGTAAYNIPIAVRIRGPLDVAALEASVNVVIGRHEALRTRFRSVEGTPFQEILPAMTVPLEVLDLRGLPEDERLEEARRISAREAQKPFDLQTGPLLRPALLRLSETDHVALLTMHHIVSDDWSTGVLLEELTTAYAALASGEAVQLPDLPLQYPDYASWQRTWLEGETRETQLAWWKGQLEDLPPILTLPLDHPRTPERKREGGMVTFDLTPDVAASIETLGRREGVTPFMILLAAYQALLARLTGQVDIAIGTPIANRTHVAIEPLIGFFVNTLVMRTDLSGSPSFRDLLGRVRESALGAYTHQELPFEMLVDALQPERNMGHSPLFQVMLVYQNAPLRAREFRGLSLAPFEAGQPTARFDLTLTVVEEGDHLSASLEYDASLFRPATAEEIAKAFATLLEAALSDPDASIARLPLLSRQDRERLLYGWNETAGEIPGECVHRLFERHAADHPERTALEFEGHCLSYGEVNRQANLLARQLHLLGAGPGDIVGVSMERSPEMVIGILGVMKSGAAYLPLDPSLPDQRLRFMMDDARVRIVVSQERHVPAIDRGERIVLTYEEVCGLHPHGGDTGPVVPVGPEDLAYVIYTSGSTGIPKGVLLGHRGLSNLVEAQTRAFGVGPESRVLQFASFGFDASVSEIFMALTRGAALILARKETLASIPDLVQLIQDAQITTATFPPSLLALLPPTEMPSLHTVISAGEVCPTELAERWATGKRFFNAYGPTEATVGPTYQAVETGSGHRRSAVPVGRPIQNMQAYILDPNLEPVPPGMRGEVCLGGVGLAWGYLHRPDLTAERFRPHPFSPVPGARLYLTGDLGRLTPEGAVEVEGRIDDQLKIRGYRVELGEIEVVASGSPGVAEVAAVAREDRQGEKRLLLYVRPAPGQEVQPAAVRAFLLERLPEYMVPQVVRLDSFPRTASGKIDRQALPDPGAVLSTQVREFIAPRDPVEETVADIWRELLGLQRISVTDNFFDLGGHSLIATQVAARLRDRLEVSLPLRTLFERPTVEGVASALIDARRGVTPEGEPPLQALPREGEIPLSFAQQRLWFLDRLEPGTPLYNLPAVVRLSGALDHAALEWSLNAVARRQEALRTVFGDVEGRAVQYILPEASYSVPVEDLSDLDPAGREQVVMRRATEEARMPFDLSRGPLVRVRLFRLGSEEHVAVLTLHHIIADGWSMGILLREFSAFYDARVNGTEPVLVELPLQYADFARWQRELMKGDTLARQLAYWKEKLAGAPPLLELPLDRPRPKVQSSSGNTLVFSLPPELTESLRAIGRQERGTLFMVLMAAFQAFLARLTGQEDISVGTPIAGRTRHEVESLIGFFVNTLVIRTDCAGDPTFRRLVQAVRATSLDAYAHQDVPFEMLVDMLEPDRDMSHTPLFQVVFALQNVPVKSRTLPGLTMTTVDAETGVAKFDLTLSMSEGDEGMSGALEYNTDLFEAATVERIAEGFTLFLQGVVRSPDSPISLVGILPEEQRRTLLEVWNGSTSSCRREPSIPERFERQVALTPDRPALVCEGRSISYRELNERANRLARRLRLLGVGPEVFVGIYLDRSPELVVAILATLKAGGAYLPLDPVYPPERISYMLNDARSPVLLTMVGMREKLAALDATAVCLDADEEQFASLSCENLPYALRPENLAYLIYTSGSTGKPKGVMVSHGNVVRLMESTDAWYRFSKEDVWTLFHSSAFDFSVWELWGSLLFGGKLVVVPYLTSRSPEAFYRLLCSEGVTVLNQTPSAFRQLIRAEESAGASEQLRLRLVIFGGEALELQSLRPWFERHGDVNPQLVNMYGITETTVHVTYRPLRLSDLSTAPGSVIGARIPDLTVYVLDRHLCPTPVGVRGELYVGGAGVARGYLDRPSLTAERFIPDPFSREPGSRLYRTGDVGRYLADGDIEYLGRMDHQVKIRGFRIELGEIESVIVQHPAVQEAHVMVREDTPGNKRLVAYVVAEAMARPTVNELRSFVQVHIPDYMVPAAFVFLAALPLTPNGKVDWRSLPSPEADRPDLGASYVAPRTPDEELIARVWGGLLGLERVGIHDNFFEAGGDSILSIQAIARLRQSGMEVSPRQLFEYPTVAGLAEVARQGASRDAIPQEETGTDGPLPLTPVQHWFFEHHAARPEQFNTSMMVELDHAVELSLLDDVFLRLINHHEALRLEFTQRDGAWTQKIGPAVTDFRIIRKDLSNLSRKRQREALESFAAELQTGFDLGRGPLLRVASVHLGATARPRLLMVFHHLVMDGVSWRMVMEDLVQGFVKARAGEPVAFNPSSTGYGRWARRLARAAASGAFLDDVAYWSRLPADPAVPIPVDGPGGENTYGSSGSLTLSLNPRETALLLNDLPAATGVHVRDLMVAALARVLSRWTGARRQWIEVEGHGREQILEECDLTRTVGWFTSIFPLLVDLEGLDGPAVEIGAVQKAFRDLPRGGMGFGVLRYLHPDIGLRRQLEALPIPEVNFNYLGQFDRGAEEGGLPIRVAEESVGPEQDPSGIRSAKLYVVGIVSGGELSVRWLFSRSLHRPATIRRLAKEYLRELVDCAEIGLRTMRRAQAQMERST
jgi:amino acid adenylation domain-containing protein/non-ribosomal peptide synthase protein (TIGR01720 family)